MVLNYYDYKKEKKRVNVNNFDENKNNINDSSSDEEQFREKYFDSERYPHNAVPEHAF